MISRQVRIIGRVQGVWYRAWTRDEALKRNLTGWVRNRIDGSVEALFHGPEDTVHQMIEACYQGPPAARVDLIEINKTDDIPPDNFRQERTL